MTFLKVCEGERGLTKDNTMLGQFYLTEIPPMPAGMPKILIKFNFDKSGILHVTALLLNTGKEANISISNAQGNNALFIVYVCIFE